MLVKHPLLLANFFVLTSLTGQITTGAISGFVLDASGRAIYNANVSILDAEHRLERRTGTDISGFYQAGELPARQYTIIVTAPRLATVTATVRVPVNASVRADFHLPLPGREESITVKAEVHLLPTESSDLGQTLDRSVIERLPLNRRDFLQLALLAPGVSPPVQGSELSSRGSFAMSVNGGREEFNNYLLDGIDNNDQENNRYNLQPPVDAIQEFKIETNDYSAEYGRSAGGQVNVLTRGGTNTWHGFAYDYFRNRVLDARNYFDGAEKGKFNRHQFGTGVGGPLWKDRLFIFGNFDGLRERQGLSRLGAVPTIAERSGDLSELPQNIKDPFTGKAFPQNRIPASRISPLAGDVLNLFPLPNLASSSGNYFGQPVLRDSDTQFNVRLDALLKDTRQVSFRYSYGSTGLFEPYAAESTGVPGFGDYVANRGHNAMLNYVEILGPRAVNSILLGVNRAARRVLPQNFQTDVNRLWGVNYLPTRPVDFGFPSISVGGFSQIGDVTGIPIDHATTTYQMSDQFSFIEGAHNFHLGGEIRNIRLNGILDELVRGSLSFSGALTGSGIGDLLLGLPALGIQAHANNPQAQRTTAINVFFQDDWKVRPDFTLNLGVRYEINTPPTDPRNQMSVFSLQTHTLTQVGTNGATRSGVKPDLNNFAPRLGFAWSLSPKTVLRGGYGIFYDSGILVVNSSLYFNPPYFTIGVFFPTATSLLTLADPFPAHGGVTPPPSPTTLSPDLATAYLQDWNFNVQRELGSSSVLSIAYAASKGTHLIRSYDLNQPFPAPGPVASRRPYPAFGSIFFIESGANSSYQALQVSVRRNLGPGLSLIGLYTHAKSIDDTSAFLADGADKNFPQNSHNYRAERALSSFDMPNRGTLAWVYALPGRAVWLRNTELRGILAVQSGQPFTPVLRFDNSNTGNTGGNFGWDRPNVLRDPQLSRRTPGEWFDTSAFAVPPPYTFGNAGRNILRGPAFSSLDVSVARRFRIQERSSLLFEVEAFNLANHTNFDLPQAYADQPSTFGQIYSAKAPRQIQLALRFEF